VTILQALDRYYDRMAARGEVTKPGYSVEPIGTVLCLSEAGELLDVQVSTDPSGKKPKPERVPKWFGRSGKGSTPYFLWDNTAYALGVGNKDPAKTARDHAAFKALHLQELRDEEDAGLRAVRLFMEAWTPDRFGAPLFNEKMLDRNVAFRLGDEHGLIHERSAAAAHVERLRIAVPSAGKVFCLVTGRLAPPVRLHPKIKGVDGTASAEVPLVSFNEDAFESYGKSQGFNAPTSEDAAFRYGAALNRLLDRGRSRNRIKIADTTTAFWADASGVGEATAKAAEDLFADWLSPAAEEPDDDKLDRDAGEAAKLHDVLREVADGRPLKAIDPRLEKGVRFHVLGLAPNAARLSVRYWLDDRFEAFAKSLLRHYTDVNIEPRPWGAGLPSVQRLLIQTVVPPKVKEPFKYLDKNAPQLAAELMRAVLVGGRYPRTLLATAITRLRADKKRAGWHAAAIKACINREYRFAHPKAKESLPVSLDPDNPSAAYQLGRLFAVLEMAQYAALDKVNSSIADRYYGAASSTPAHVFGALIRNARHHISDANKRGKGRWLNSRLTEIVGRLPVDLPTTLKMEDQGRFAVGYYHQRGSRWKKEADPETAEAAQAEEMEEPDAAH
jgi:CRISPR-associated protein Csd1